VATKKKAPPVKKAPGAAQKVSTPSSADADSNTLHGVTVLGDVKKGGNAKRPISAQLRIEQIRILKGFNPRNDLGDLDSLARSIKTDGLLSALVVRPAAKDSQFELVAGERRYRALESLGWKEAVPVLIRVDLVGDDDRALAVAVAENSEDGRSNLNPIELGRVCAQFEEKGWTVAQIATECGMHVQKVRRVLTLMTQPRCVRDKIAGGEITLNAGLELARLDEKVRDDVIKAMADGGASSAADIRRLRKQVETEEGLAEAATSGSKKTRAGTTPKRVATAWRGSREKQQALQEPSARLSALQRDEADADFLEARAQIVVLLWDRGDLQAISLPHESAQDTASQKALKVFWSIVKQEAAKQAQADAEGEGEAKEKKPAKKAKKAKPAKPIKKAKPEAEAEGAAEAEDAGDEPAGLPGEDG